MQAVDVGLGEHAAFAGDFMQFDPVIALKCQLGYRNLQLRIDLVDDRSGAAGALIVHRRNFFLAARLVVIFEDDDLRILSTQLNHRIHFGMQLLNRQ